MIHLTRLNHKPLLVNTASVQYVESTPDTVLVFNNGDRILVTESVDEVIAKVVEFHRRVFAGVVVAKEIEE